MGIADVRDDVVVEPEEVEEDDEEALGGVRVVEKNPIRVCARAGDLATVVGGEEEWWLRAISSCFLKDLGDLVGRGTADKFLFPNF